MTENGRGIGPRIAEARHAGGLSQSQLAALIGNSTSAIQSWELGVRHPRIGALQALAKALGRDVSWFYEDETKAAAA
jgi:transcriptional regulator with XRE-family HTH domain